MNYCHSPNKEGANKPAPPNLAIASQLHAGCLWREVGEPDRSAAAAMNTLRVVAFLFLAHPVVAQVYCVRAIGHTPFYERIFLAKGNPLRPSTLRGVDDLGPLARYPETNRIDRVFTEFHKERTNGLYVSCLSEVPLSPVAFRAPGGLISFEQVRELLRDTVAVPRNSWTNHLGHTGGGRYVLSFLDSKSGEIVIDLRAGGCAVVFFPDQTFRCIMPQGISCLKTQAYLEEKSKRK